MRAQSTVLILGRSSYLSDDSARLKRQHPRMRLLRLTFQTWQDFVKATPQKTNNPSEEAGPRSLRFAEHLELRQRTQRRAAKGAGRINTLGLKPDGRFTLSQGFF